MTHVIIQGTLVGWERSVQGQLDNLKLWLELQFTTLNRKVDGIAEDVNARKRHKKVCYGCALLLKLPTCMIGYHQSGSHLLMCINFIHKCTRMHQLKVEGVILMIRVHLKRV